MGIRGVVPFSAERNPLRIQFDYLRCVGAAFYGFMISMPSPVARTIKRVRACPLHGVRRTPHLPTVT